MVYDRKLMGKTLAIILAVAFFAAVSGAHSLYLFGISLDFDSELKSNAIKSAQEFYKTDIVPLSFDLDKGLIAVHFEEDNRKYAEINPLDYSVSGMRNENLKHKIDEGKTSKKLSKGQGREIAQKIFDSLPQMQKSELKYSIDVEEVSGTYFYKWFRYHGDAIVVGEDFFVNVDMVNGNVIAWRLSIFDYPKDSIKTTPAITKNVAVKISELFFNSPSVEDFKPYLIIVGKEPVWVNKIQGQFYPYFAGVSAYDGNIVFSGILPGEVPEEYFYSPNEVVENDLIKKIYSSK